MAVGSGVSVGKGVAMAVGASVGLAVAADVASMGIVVAIATFEPLSARIANTSSIGQRQHHARD